MEKFPKSQKFLLGDRMQTLALDVQESLIEATYTKNPAPHLLANLTNVGVDVSAGYTQRLKRC